MSRMLTWAILRLIALSLPIAFMIALVPYVKNDFVLAGIYLFIIVVSSIRYSSKDVVFFVFGFFALFIAEYFFILTGVEVFERRSLLGVMPVWLPLLWAYVFVAIKRGALIIERHLA